MKLPVKKITKVIPLVSSSDLAFILIIFFILTSNLQLDEGFKLSLSDKTIKPINIKSVLIEAKIIDDNFIIVNNKKVSRNEFEFIINNYIKEKKVEKDKFYISLEINKDVRYETVVNIIDFLRENELHNFSLNLVK